MITKTGEGGGSRKRLKAAVGAIATAMVIAFFVAIANGAGGAAWSAATKWCCGSEKPGPYPTASSTPQTQVPSGVAPSPSAAPAVTFDTPTPAPPTSTASRFEDPVAYWPLNQTSGSVKDAKGGHPLVLAGTDWSVGHDGDALSFDGSSSRATGGPVVNTSRSFTVAAWVRLGSADHDYETIVSQNGRVTFGFNLRCIDHKWYFTTDPSDTLDRALSISSPSPAKEGVWTYLTGVYDAGAGKILLYVNGRFAASSPVAGVFDATGSLTVGYDPFKGKPSWYNGYFSGQIDDLRVYGVALTSSQVAQLPTLTG